MQKTLQAAAALVAVAAAYVMLRPKPSAAAGKAAVVATVPATLANNAAAVANPNSLAAQVSEIANTALPGQNGYGWRYFTDGTSIDPTGSYYQGGANPLWVPPAS